MMMLCSNNYSITWLMRFFKIGLLGIYLASFVVCVVSFVNWNFGCVTSKIVSKTCSFTSFVYILHVKQVFYLVVLDLSSLLLSINLFQALVILSICSDLILLLGLASKTLSIVTQMWWQWTPGLPHVNDWLWNVWLGIHTSITHNSTFIILLSIRVSSS